MTDTLSAIRNKLLLVCAVCFAVIGVLLYAPTVSAYTEEQYNACPSEVQTMISYYTQDTNIEQYEFIYGLYPATYDPPNMTWGVLVYVPKSDDIIPTAGYDVSREGYVSFTNSFASQYFKCFIRGYFQGSNPSFPSDYNYYTGISNSDAVPSDFTATWRSYLASTGTFGSYLPIVLFGSIDEINNLTPSTLSYSPISPPIDTDEQTYADVLLQSYLHDNDIDVDKATAWIILYSGEPIQIPISYSKPTNYSGDFYVKQTSATPYLDKFSVVAVNPDYDFSRYRGARVCIKYPFDVTTLKLYGLYADTPLDYQPTIAFDPTLPQGSNYVPNQLNGIPGLYDFSGKTYYGRFLTMSDTVNVNYPVYISWDMWVDPLSAIPRTHSLLVGIDLTVTDSNGDATIGRDTTNYNNFVTNYNNDAIAGLTGTISGRTNFQGDWRGQNVNTEIHYSDSDFYQIDDDDNVTSIFTTVFELGDGMLLELSIGVLSIAFASYILFGKH